MLLIIGGALALLQHCFFLFIVVHSSASSSSLLLFCHSFSFLSLRIIRRRMTTTPTISPLSVRQWKDNKEHTMAMMKEEDNTNENNDIAMNLGQSFNVSAAQSLLLQQIIPTYAEMAHSFSTQHTLTAKHLSMLLKQLQVLANSLHIHLAQAIRNKIQLNGRKYPVEQAKVSD